MLSSRTKFKRNPQTPLDDIMAVCPNHLDANDFADPQLGPSGLLNLLL